MRTLFPSTIFYLFLTCLTLTGLTAPAQAGSWSALSQAGDRDCALLFEGIIEKGDLTRASDTGLLDSFGPRICLNSPGGSLAEVLAFLEAAEGQGGFHFGTRIRSGEECLSSCAILFMFGQAYGANSPYPSRQMEPGGRLGFHSPFIRDGATPAASDAEVFRVALQVAKLLADRSYTAVTTAGPALPQELLALVLGTPSGVMRHVDTIGEARLLNIELLQDLEAEAVFADQRDSIDRLLKRICISSHTLTYRQHMVVEGYDYSDLVRRATDPESLGPNHQVLVREREPAQGFAPEKLRAVLIGPGYFLPGWYSVGSQMYCRVELTLEQGSGGFTVQSYQVDFDFVNGADLTRVPEPTTTINAMSGGVLPLDTLYAR